MRIIKRLLAGALIGAIVFTAVPAVNGTDRVKAAYEYELSPDVKYLSDMEYITGRAKDNKLYKDRNASNQTIKLVTSSSEDSDGKLILNTQPFIKGMGAWATSELVYAIPDGFEYFETYLGVDAARQETYYNGGVTFRIYLSNNQTDWELKESTGTLKGWDVAQKVKLALKNYKFIKLEADENGNSFYSSWYDDAVYADAKFTRNNYAGEGIDLSAEIKTLATYDGKIEGFINSDSLSAEQRFTVLKREYISRIGYDVLASYYKLSSTYKNAVDWLFSDINNLQYYLDVNLGSSENYAKSLTILADLYASYSTDFSEDLYKRMAIALSCSHVNGVSFWATGGVTNGSEAKARYQIYKDLYSGGRLNTALFTGASIPEMRIIMANQISDDQIKWLNWYAASKKGTVEPDYSTPNLAHGNYINYNSHLNWNYNDPKYFKEDGSVQDWVIDKYHLTSGGVNTNDSKLWAVMEEGAVCGGQSKTGANLRGVYGIPSFVIGQPGHAAYFYQSGVDDSGNRLWTIGNNIYGWWKSEYGGNMLGWTGGFKGIRWAGATGPDGRYYTGSYLVLEQAAVNDIGKLRESRIYVYMAKSTDEASTKKSLYKKALSILPINVEAWLGVLDSNGKLSTGDEAYEGYEVLAEKIAGYFKYYPLPMSDLLTLIKNNLISENTEKANIETLRTKTLMEAKGIDNSVTLQPDVTRNIAENLLSTSQVEMATFSLDGPNAGKIIFDASYRTDSENTAYWYSLTGAQTNENGEVSIAWKRSTQGIIELSEDELNSLSEENGIFVKLEGQSDNQLFSITLTRAEKPEGLAANDDDDDVLNYVKTMQWSLDNGATWTRFDERTPDLSGNTTVWVRNGATGHTLASREHEVLTFTESDDPITKRYISALNIEVEASTNHNQSTLAENVLDGNVNTYWSTTQRFSDSYKRIIFSFDKERFITSVDVYPRQNNDDGRMVSLEIGASQDDECNVVSTLKTIDMTKYTGNDPVTINFDKPVYTQFLYIKELDYVKDYICISMVKFYEDRTKDADDEEDTEVNWEIDEVVEIAESGLFIEDVKIQILNGERYITSGKFTGKKVMDITDGSLNGNNPTGIDIISEKYASIVSKQIIDSKGDLVEEDAPITTGMRLQIFNRTKETETPDHVYILAVPAEEGDPELPVFDEHTHIFDAAWSFDETHHWKSCIGRDEEVDRYGEHTGELQGERAATTTKKGYTGDLYCSECGILLLKGHYTAKLEDNSGNGDTGQGGQGNGDTGQGGQGDGGQNNGDQGNQDQGTGSTPPWYNPVIPSGGGGGGSSAPAVVTVVNISEMPKVDAVSQEGKLTVDVSGNAAAKEVTLTKDLATEIAKELYNTDNTAETFEIKTKNISVELDAKAMESLVTKAAGDEIRIVFEDDNPENMLPQRKTALTKSMNITEDAISQVFRIYIESNGKRIDDFDEGTITIGKLDFTPKVGQDTKYFHVIKINEDNTVIRLFSWVEGHTIYFRGNKI